jgi:iron-regulated transporter 1
LAQLSQAGCYAIFLFLFNNSPTDDDLSSNTTRPISWPSIVLLVILASTGRIATTGIDLAVCRDWILVIAADPESVGPSTSAATSQPNELLTFLTTSLRRITLVCKLLSPLLISVLTTAAANRMTSAILLGLAALTLASEMIWIGVVWRKFEGVLEHDEVQRAHRRAVDVPAGEEVVRNDEDLAMDNSSNIPARIATPVSQPRNKGTSPRGLLATAVRALAPWNEFRKMPIFLSM